MPAVPIGGEITTFTVTNTSASVQSGVVETIGQVFKSGALPAQNAGVELVGSDNVAVPCQLDAKAFHADGSVRHGILSFILPEMSANESRVYRIRRTSAPIGGSPATPSDFPGLTAVANITPTGTALAGPSPAGLYVADAASKLASGAYETWLSGPICSEWIVRAPLVHSTLGEHPDLHVRFNIRAYKGMSKAKIDYIVENNWAKPASTPINNSPWESVSVTDQIYRCNLKVGSTVAHQRNAKAFISVRAAVGSGIFGGTLTGLANDATNYTATLQVNGTTYPIAVTGASAQTYSQLFAIIRSQCNNLVSCVADKFVYNFEIRTEATGSEASVVITDYGTLFPALRQSGLSAAASPVINYTATVTVDGTIVKNVSIPGNQAQRIGQVVSLLNAQLEGVAFAKPDLLGGIVFSSASTGQTSGVAITNAGTLFPILNNNKLAPCRPIYGDEVVHYAGTRWKETFWWGEKPQIHVAHNKQYLIESKAVPNYPLDLVGDNTIISKNLANIQANSDLMDNGMTKAVMGDVGYAPGIGILPEWQAMYIVNQGADAKYVMLKQADRMGAWPVCFRDYATDLPISFERWPYATIAGNTGDSYNPATKLNEKLPSRIASTHIVGNRNTPDVSHHPDFNFVPYLVTGDHYYMEGMLFYQRFTTLTQNPHATYRAGRSGLFKGEQVRAQGWAIRTLVHALYLVPSSHLLVGDLTYNMEQNRLWYEANYLASGATNYNTFGAIVNGPSIIYEMGAVGSVPKAANTGLAPWMDDFVTSSYGRAVELGFEQWLPMFNYKAKMPIGRLTSGSAFCWQAASLYNMRLRDTQASAIYTTWGEAYLKSLNEVITSNQCGSSDMATALGVAPNSMIGYPSEIGGYPSNLQPAVAYASSLNVAGGQDAWEVFDSRSVKPNYNLGPQFAIIPRIQEVTSVSTPTDNYTVPSGQSMYFGQNAPSTALTFNSITVQNVSDGLPGNNELGKPLVVDLHGSSGQGNPQGKAYTAKVGGRMAFDTQDTFNFYLVAAYVPINGINYRFLKVRPIDQWMNGTTKRESMHMGFLRSDGFVHLYSENRYDAMMAWLLENATQYDLNKRCLSGGSMGAWGTITYGVRRYNMFAALYPDRPRWRYGYNVGEVAVSSWDSGWTSRTVANAPQIAPEDGGGSYAEHLDLISYIANPANKVRPVLWCCGKADGFMPWSEQCDAVDAFRAAGRAFAFFWNEGSHTTGPSMGNILQSYNYGTYSLDKGWPVFTEHSLDKDPRVDPVGSINGGLSFKNVVETASGWSCEVTNVLSACTVKVKPQSDVFTANVPAKSVTIPAANTWVLVEFNA